MLAVFAGQSNAQGFGMDRSTLPPGAYVPDPLTYIWSHKAMAWVQMVPGTNTGIGSAPEMWGPEVAFAQAFRAAHPTEVLMIVKYADGSTGLAADPTQWDWSPDSAGELFDGAVARIAEARNFFGPLWKPDVDAVFWMQGETDAFNYAKAQAYEENLRGFLDAVRDEWMEDPTGDVVWGRINDAQPYFETVRWAQYVVDRDTPHTASFDTYDYDMQADGLHYAAGGHLALGAAFFDAWAGL